MTLDFIKEPQLEFLREGKYILENETPQERFLQIIEKVREYEPMYSEGLADRIEYMIDKNILSCSTPVISNFGRPKDSKKNTAPLPASCYIATVGNSVSDIYYSLGEVAMASKLGGGISTDYDLIIQKGTEISNNFHSNSKLDWIEDSVATAQKVSQTNRRGYNTPYLSIMDKDFYTLMERIDKTNPVKTDPLINNTIGIKLPLGFRELLKKDKEAQKRYMLALKNRKATGKLYLVDEENCNKNSSLVYKKLDLSVSTSNICTEFLQPLFPQYTSVCVISALNLMHWDEIKKNPQMIKDAFMFLDIVNEEYIKLSEGVPFLEKAHRSAKEKRDIGLGALGFAELLQKRGYAFGDIYSRALNKEIFSTIRKYGEEVTTELGEKLGSPLVCQMAEMVRRNASLMMIAPNKSTSFISSATSGGIEPFMSNIFMKSLAKIQYVWKNPHLEVLLEEKGKNNTVVWDSIQDNNGSVQHLDFLDQHEKDVFKTFAEISPKDIIDLVSDRQEFIDMGQSLNLMFRKNYTMKDIYDIHKYAWDKGVKTLYYAYNTAHAALEKDGESWDSCASCSD
jgi:ribonucleoside-diphosphate reductase alpha chain